jgi:hypothetical protein
MNIYEITGWSWVPGDKAIVEAESEEAAKQKLAECVAPHDPKPQSEWRVFERVRPLYEIIWRD